MIKELTEPSISWQPKSWIGRERMAITLKNFFYSELIFSPQSTFEVKNSQWKVLLAVFKIIKKSKNMHQPSTYRFNNEKQKCKCKFCIFLFLFWRASGSETGNLIYSAFWLHSATYRWNYNRLRNGCTVRRVNLRSGATESFCTSLI